MDDSPLRTRVWAVMVNDERIMPDYINKLTLRLQPGLVFGPNISETALLDCGGCYGDSAGHRLFRDVR